MICDIGGRGEMEDTHFLDMDFNNQGWIFGGVYDGHGGRFAADYAAENLHQRFLEKLRAGQAPGKAFVETYQAISDELKEQDSGTTAVNFLIKKREIFTANVGDVRALVVGHKDFHQLTTDHRLDDPQEKERIEEKGGQISYPYTCRGFRGLMPTRTLGDEYFKPVGVIARPSVNKYKITKDDVMLLTGCDGLFDVMDNEEVVDFARDFWEPNQLVEVLKREALENRSCSDNLTIMAVCLKR